MSDLLTTSAETAVQLAGGSRRSKHGRRAEGIRFRARFHPLLTRCGRRKASGLDWTYGAPKRARDVPKWGGAAMRTQPLGPSVELPMGPRNV